MASNTTPKKPQDRKPPQSRSRATAKKDAGLVPAPSSEALGGTAEGSGEATEAQAPEFDEIEFNGQTYKINYDAINDIEVLEAFQKNVGFLPADVHGSMVALQKALGPEYERLKRDYKANHNGVMPATAIIDLFFTVNGRASGN